MSRPPETFPWDDRPIAYPPELPITQRKDEIIAAIRANPVIVLAGETGSGKTTQIPKMCLEAGLGRTRKIACTQPRRVAALSVAKRVAEELQVDFGAEVGAKIRFTDQTGRRTRVKFLTDGMLLAEVQADPMMREYDAVIVDEAHERSLNIDFLLGHLNQLRAKRPELKVIVTSATIDTQKFSEAFGGAPIIEVSGRVYPVEVIYAPLDELLEDSGDFTYLEGVAESVQRIQDELGLGDILTFLPTEKDIREAMDLLEGRFGRRMEIVPCFGRLSTADQQRIFTPTQRRKLVLATNIAETSLTIPGIRFVIDAGLARISRYNPRGRTKSLPIVKVSQSSANQRKGRCGRVADGVCIRLYSEKDFLSRPIYTTPEIQRSNLADVILRMLANKLGDVETFPFIDPPSAPAIAAGYALLHELGAVSDVNELTPFGYKLSRLPVDPTVGRMLLEAERQHVVDQILVIASALSIQDPRERPMGQETAARAAHSRFDHKESDFLTLLNIWESLHDDLERLSQGRLRKFCKQHYMSYLRIREWRDVHEQLKRSLDDFEKRAARHGNQNSVTENISPFAYPNAEERDASRRFGGAEYRAIHTCLLTGLLSNPGRREEQNLYLCPGNRKPLIFPGSALFIRTPFNKKGQRKPEGTEAGPKKKTPEWIMSGEIIETSKLYARTNAAIDPAWLIAIGGHIIKRSYSDPLFILEEGRVIARESIRIHGLEIQNRKVSYSKVDPVKATEIFIREGLLNEEFFLPHPFLDANRKLMSRIQNAQTVISVAHWMGVEEAAFNFYRSTLDNVSSTHDLNRAIRQSGGDGFLRLSEADLTASEEAAVDLSLFPETVELAQSALPIEYLYKPGHEKDGVTLKLPYHQSKAIDSVMLDWLIPGHLEAKIHLYLKALPKDIRHRLLPLAETAKTISQAIRPTGQTLAESLARHLKDRYSIETYASDWDEKVIPDHLKSRIEVIDKKGETVAEGRDLLQIQAQIAAKEAAISKETQGSSDALWRKARERWERPVETLTDFSEVESKIEIGQHNGIPVFAYPGLRVANRSHASGRSELASDALSSVSLHLFRSERDARAATRQGISALIGNEIRYELAWIQKDLKEVSRVGPVAVVFRPMEDLKADVYEHIRRELCRHELDTIDPAAIKKAALAARARSKGFLYIVVDQLKAILDKRQSLIIKGDIVKEFGRDIDRLLPPDFLRETSHWVLVRLPVYLDCIEKRVAKRKSDPKRDASRSVQLARFRERLAQLPAAEQARGGELFWMLEEFAISLFAQELGTAYPVSDKRIDDRLKQAGSAPAINAPTAAKSAAPAKSAPANRPTQADLDSLKKLFG